MTLADETLTLADDEDGANIQFEFGEFNGTDFATTTVPANDTFVSISFEVGGNGPDFGSFALVTNDSQVTDVDYAISSQVELLEVGLFDSTTDTLIATLDDNTQINASDIEGRDLTIAAFVPDESPLFGEVGSVFLDVNNGQVTRTENVEPYALFGDRRDGTDLNGGDLDLAAGNNTVSFDIFSERRLSGELLDTVVIDFTVVDESNAFETLNFEFTVEGGILDGEEGTVSLTYDTLQVDPSLALQNVRLSDVTFTLAGETLTLADDEDGANIQFEFGEFNGTDFATTTVPANDTFVSISFEVGGNGPDFGSFALVTNDSQVTDVDYGVPNTSPVAGDDSFTTDEDVALMGDVSTNDVDAEGDALTFTLDGQATNGFIDFNEDGTFTYFPELDFFGTDSFTYTVSDGEFTDTAIVDITVNEVAEVFETLNF
ncbi:MAG: Ig-like domain-containing protein, partial [Cyanobacteria bacterium J06638_20]